MSENPKIVVAVPHQDDEFMAAGTIAQYSKDLGIPIEVLFMTNGDKGKTLFEGELREPKNNREKQALIKLRKAEAAISLGLLGVNSANISNWEDVPTRSLAPTREIINRMKRFLHKKQPTVVLGFSEAGTTLHPDHIASAFIMHQAIKELLQAGLIPGFLRYLTFNLPQALTMLAKYGEIITDHTILTTIDIAKHTQTKNKALHSHKSQSHIIQAFVKNGVLRAPSEYFLERIARADSSAMGKSDLLVGLDQENQQKWTIHPMPLEPHYYMSSHPELLSQLIEKNQAILAKAAI